MSLLTEFLPTHEFLAYVLVHTTVTRARLLRKFLQVIGLQVIG
ncbi:MAG: hypothetical protein AAFZ80_04105 [Cyanobacteria bacterium P01_A01_bin.105]